MIRKNALTMKIELKMSPLLTKINYPTPGGHSVNKKNAPSPGRHVFQPIRTIFQLVQNIIGTNLLTKKNAQPPFAAITNVLTKFHEDWTINENAPLPGRNVFQPTKTIIEIVQDILGANLLTKVFKRKNALLPGSHVFQATVTIFELVQDIIQTNLLTKFHEDLIKNVSSRVLTRKMLPLHEKAITKSHHEHIVLR
ncbi:hypothetical protein DPMN_008374 [Dreissena polymorpha]|uniref:Uncharacterized protein n=1 Tax=Dreissena polymorpha TaxID=45954 RepID=A0A9D4MYN4_DREPO|nr:hypothetical protein DPMN_008374 [Dreissena polymorpha]